VTVGMRDEARLQVEAARAAIEAEERVDSELRRKFGARWSRSLSSSINAPLRKDLDAIDKQLALAAKADETVQGKLEGSKALLDLLDQPAENLDALVAGSSDPSQAMQEATSVEKAQRLVAELKAVVYDIERLLTARDAIRVQAISHKDSEDAVRVLSVYILQGTAPEAAFKALLGQYQVRCGRSYRARPRSCGGRGRWALRRLPAWTRFCVMLDLAHARGIAQGFREKFVANHGEVEAALLKLEEGNARFLEARQQSAEVSRREMAIKDISMAIDAFTEIAAYVREGQSWYTAMQEKIARVRERAEDFKVARDIQKEDLIEAIAEQSAREPPPPAVQIVAQPVAAQPAAAPSLSAVPSFSAPPPPSPSRTNWTRLVPPSVLTGHVSSLSHSRPSPRRPAARPTPPATRRSRGSSRGWAPRRPRRRRPCPRRPRRVRPRRRLTRRGTRRSRAGSRRGSPSRVCSTVAPPCRPRPPRGPLRRRPWSHLPRRRRSSRPPRRPSSRPPPPPMSCRRRPSRGRLSLPSTPRLSRRLSQRRPRRPSPRLLHHRLCSCRQGARAPSRPSCPAAPACTTWRCLGRVGPSRLGYTGVVHWSHSDAPWQVGDDAHAGGRGVLREPQRPVDALGPARARSLRRCGCRLR